MPALPLPSISIVSRGKRRPVAKATEWANTPGRHALRKRDGDLAEMAAALHQPQRLGHGVEIERAVDHRLEAIAPNCRGHAFKHATAADREPDDMQVLAEYAGNADLLGEAGQYADHENGAADLCGF